MSKDMLSSKTSNVGRVGPNIVLKKYCFGWREWFFSYIFINLEILVQIMEAMCHLPTKKRLSKSDHRIGSQDAKYELKAGYLTVNVFLMIFRLSFDQFDP